MFCREGGFKRTIKPEENGAKALRKLPVTHVLQQCLCSSPKPAVVVPATAAAPPRPPAHPAPRTLPLPSLAAVVAAAVAAAGLAAAIAAVAVAAIPVGGNWHKGAGDLFFESSKNESGVFVSIFAALPLSYASVYVSSPIYPDVPTYCTCCISCCCCSAE